MVCCFGLGGGLCVYLSSRHRRDASPTPSTRRFSVSGTRDTHGGGGGCAAKRSVTSTDVQAFACFMCAATPLTCASRRCLLDLSRASYLRRCATWTDGVSVGAASTASRGQLHAVAATLEKGRRFTHARRERALFNFVRVLDGRLGHADGLWVSGGGRRGEVDARGFVGGRRVGACERRSRRCCISLAPERRRCDARKGRRVTHASLVGSLWRAPRLLFLVSGRRRRRWRAVFEAFLRRPRRGAGWG